MQEIKFYDNLDHHLNKEKKIAGTILSEFLFS
jgi:hypothetical protein